MSNDNNSSSVTVASALGGKSYMAQELLLETNLRGDLARQECLRQGVKFLPLQVLRRAWANAGVPAGPYPSRRTNHVRLARVQ